MCTKPRRSRCYKILPNTLNSQGVMCVCVCVCVCVCLCVHVCVCVRVLHVHVYILCGMCVVCALPVCMRWSVCVLQSIRNKKCTTTYVHACVRDTHRHSPPGVLCRPLPRRSSAWSATHRSAPTSQTLKETEAQEQESGGSTDRM